jgi:hypothetical protein
MTKAGEAQGSVGEPGNLADVRAASAYRMRTKRSEAFLTNRLKEPLSSGFTFSRGQDLNLRPLDATKGIATTADKTRKIPNTSVL